MCLLLYVKFFLSDMEGEGEGQKEREREKAQGTL